MRRVFEKTSSAEYVNGARHEGSFDFETMLEAIQARMQGLAA